MAIQHDLPEDAAVEGGNAALLATLQADFDTRLARLAAEPAQWIEFVDRVAAFGARYSLSNQILLMIQAEKRGIEPRWFLPYGRRDGSTGWRATGRWVRRGEPGFKIWAPVRRRPSEDQAQQWEAAGRNVDRDASGRPAPQVAGFRLATVFELSQTDGEPFEPPTVLTRRLARAGGGTGPQLLTGDDPTGAYDDLVRLIEDAGYRYELAPPHTGYLGGANGITVAGSETRLVQVRDDLDPAQRTKTTMHELAHIRCGHLDGNGVSVGAVHRGRAETEAESVAHITLRALGLDTAAFSDAYVFGWAGGDLNLVQDCAAIVLRTAKALLDDLAPAENPDRDPGQAGPPPSNPR